MSDRVTAPPAEDRGRRQGMRTPDEVAAMLRLKALGWGVRRIAAEFGCSHGTVRRYLKADGWVEYQAPQDVLNAFGFEPVRDLQLDLGGAPPVNPKIRSARFKETLSPATYQKLRWNFFRVHFHFLAANEVPGEYDYLMIACGPTSLADRIADPEAAVRAAYGRRSAPASEPDRDAA